MTDERIRQLFHDLAEPVPASTSQRTGDLWRRAMRRRRRRRAGAGALTAAVVAAVVAVVVQSPWEQPPPVASPPGAVPSPHVTAEEIGGIPVDVAPGVEEEKRLTHLLTLFPSAINAIPGSFLPLSKAPVPRALALFQISAPGKGDSVYVLGADRRMRIIDTLRPTVFRDESGNVQILLDGSSLSPDGRRAALARRDEITVVDLTTGESTAILVQGLFDNVRWRADGTTLIATGKKGTVAIDLTARDEPRARPLDGGYDWASETGRGAVPGAVGLAASPPDGPPRLAVQTPGGPAVTRPLPEVAEVVGEWIGEGRRSGDLIARSGFAAPGGSAWQRHGSGEAVVVLDARTGEVVRSLLFPYEGPRLHGRFKACCPVAGWLDARTVLLTSASSGTPRLLAWNLQHGTLLQIAELLPDTTFSFGPLH